MYRGSIVRSSKALKREIEPRYRKLFLDRKLAKMPVGETVSLERASHVLLLCSRFAARFEPQVYVQELAFAHELASRNRKFALSEDPSEVFDKSLVWFLPTRLVSPRLWDYSRQVYEFAAALERQGNHLFCSSHEVSFWENKAEMHRKLDEIDAPTPWTEILSRENWRDASFAVEPLLIKEEHSAGSLGIHYFATGAEAQAFVANYPFRPHEKLIMQEVIRGIRDLRLTLVGDRVIKSATYWRIKSPDALAQSDWATTATTYNSIVEHGNIPDSVVSKAAQYLRDLGLRTAGIDLMWQDDDLSREALLLEFSPYYQPNPPKPKRYEHWTYKQYKQKPYVTRGYLLEQYTVFREIAGEILDQGLF